MREMLTGESFIGSDRSGKGEMNYFGVDPTKNEQLAPAFVSSTPEEIDAAIAKAQSAFDIYRKKSGAEKAQFLNAIADEILNLGDELINRCTAESGLPIGRITGERGRTMGQLRLFADLLSDGTWVDARIDPALPDREPMARVDLRSMERAIGPVGIFGASNFPLAFSVAGGDTASALAAGCSVVVKAHPAHPGTCELIATAIIKATLKTNMPDGVFSMIQGPSVEVGIQLVKDARIKAIGFTGSHRGGKALFDAASARPEPIPVYAEMGSTNPVFILPVAMSSRGESIASGLAGSITLGVGQFCTNPGLVVRVDDEHADKFDLQLQKDLAATSSSAMLTTAIKSSYQSGLERLENLSGVTKLLNGADDHMSAAVAALYSTTGDTFCNDHSLETEVFGPSSIIIKTKSKEELMKVASSLSGHLTATLIGETDELEDYQGLIDILEKKVGRLIINGYPTGVEVCHAMVHGGPYPATTDSRSTSVGTAAIKRFTRPICYQNFPDALLPDELKYDNPLGIYRLVNGQLSQS